MEKIQQALAKARAERGGVSEPLVQRPIGQPPAAVPQTTTDRNPAAWAQLTPWQADPETLRRARVMTLSGGVDASAFDVMRTKTLQTMRANNWSRLAITSPSPGCGKSTLALNLAFSLSRQADLSSMVIELDLRRPSLSRTLGVSVETSVSQVLDGSVRFADQAICHGGNLAFSLCNSPVRNAADILHNPATITALADIERDYRPDTMIFDMPPMLVSDDMMAFAGQVDCVLLVAAAETTTIKEIDTCERELASLTNFMGVLLNKCRYMGKDYGYSYYG